MPSHARQLRRVRGGPQARRHRQARDQQLSRAAGRLRLGGAARRDRGRARRDAGGVRPPSARGRGRPRRPPAAEDRGVRRFAVRRAAYHRGRGRRAEDRRGQRVRQPQLRALGPQPHRARLQGRARTRRARARAAEERLGLRALCADGRDRRPLFPGARRGGDGAREARGAALLARRLAAREHRVAVLRQAEAHHHEARHRAAAGERRQALRRARAGRVPRPGRVLPRRVRPPGAHQPVDRRRARDGAHRDPGRARHDRHRAGRDHPPPRRLRRAGRRAHHDRRRLRHELRAHAGAEMGVRLSPDPSRPWWRSTPSSSGASARPAGFEDCPRVRARFTASPSEPPPRCQTSGRGASSRR